jgi:chemotaxis protein CheD
MGAGIQSKDIFLRPGEFHFGDEDTQIRTILGSCVAITLWHPKRKIGGMCHYMLSNPRKTHSNPGRPDGRYAEDAMHLFLDALMRTKTMPREYQVKMFGGGNMFPTLNTREENNIGQRNLIIGQELLHANGFYIHATHLGGVGYRRIIFNMRNGEVLLYHNVNSSASQKDGKVI